MGLENLFQKGKNHIRNALIAGLASSAFLLSCGKDSPTAPPQPPPPPQQNRPPVINSSPVTSVSEHSFYEYRIQATDPDGDPIAYSLVEGPAWLSVSHNIVYGNPPEVLENSVFPVKVKVSDGRAFTEQPYNLNVQNLFNSYVVSSNTTNPLVVAQESSLTFSQPVNFTIGDILAADTSQITPYGVLREITSISSDRIRVNTQQATLEKIIRDGSFSFSGTISQSNVQSSAFVREGVSLAPRSETQSQGFGLNLTNVVLYDVDGNPLTTGDQLVANGRIEFDSDPYFKADVRGIRLRSLEFKNKSSIISDVTLGSNILGIASKIEVPLGEYYFSPIITPSPIGGLPIVIVPKVGFYVGIDPTYVNPLSVRVSQQSSLETGLKYDGSWNPNATFSTNFDFSNPILTGEWDLSVYATPRLTLLFGGILGTSAGVSADLRLESTGLGDWKLYGGLGAGLGVSMEIFTKQIAAYYTNVVDFEKLLADYLII